MKYKLAYLIIWICRLLNKTGSYRYYKNTYILEDINGEAYCERISKQMNRTWQ